MTTVVESQMMVLLVVRGSNGGGRRHGAIRGRMSDSGGRGGVYDADDNVDVLNSM